MISAETLKMLTTMGTYALSKLLAISGYTGCSFKSTKFLGITNGGEFCYSVTYHDESGTGEITDKVFVKYNTAENLITAKF